MPKSARSLWTDKLTGKPVTSPTADPSALRGPASFQGVILGIDPSLRGTGLALVDFSKGVEAGKLLGSRTLKLKGSLSQSQCLGEIHTAVAGLVEAHSPDCLVLEQTIYVQNFQTAQIMGMARGAAIGPAAAKGIDVHDYAPLRIKQAVVGYGRASKEQVASMVRQHLKLAADLLPDEADAAAAALCHAFTCRG